MAFANPNIKLAKQVRHITLLKPFFHKTYERAMEKQAALLLTSDPAKVKDVALSLEHIGRAAAAMGKVRLRPKVGKAGFTQRTVGAAAAYVSLKELVAVKEVVAVVKDTLDDLARLGVNFQTTVEMVASAALILLSGTMAVVVGLALHNVHLIKNEERARIGAELRKAANSVLDNQDSVLKTKQ